LNRMYVLQHAWTWLVAAVSLGSLRWIVVTRDDKVFFGPLVYHAIGQLFK
jgi:hypothetical protein